MSRAWNLKLRALHEPLHVPAVLTELDGQPVEQLWVARRLALRAEVLGGLDQTGA